KENKKLLVDSVLNGPFDYRIITEAGTATTPAIVRKRRYDELIDAEKLHEACDIKSTNIVLQGLPQDIYNLERESKLYDEFDMFTSLAKDLNNTNFDQLYAYLRQHEAHADEVRIMKERFLNPLALVANTYNSSPSYSIQTQHEQQISPFASQKQVSSLSSQQLYDVPMIQHRLVVLSFLPSDDPITSLNKMEDYRADSLGRKNQGYASVVPSDYLATHGNKTRRTNTAGPAKVICWYNCQEEGHMARQCTKPKRPRNSAWFKEKAMLAEALESGRVLDDELMAFLADNGDTVTTVQQSKEIPTPTAFQTDDLDAFDSDYDEAPSYFEQHDFNYNPDINIISDSNMISYEQYLKETENTVLQDTSFSAQNDAMIMYVIEEMSNQVAKCNEHFVPQKQLFVEQAFWLPILKLIFEIPPVQPEPVLKEIPHELPTFSLVKDTFNKISHVNDFENVVTVRTKVTGLHKEITNMKEVFTQMETKVAKRSVERKTFEIKEKELLLENERLLELLLSQDLVHTAVNSLAEIIDYQNMEKSFLNEYAECVELKAELSKKNEMVEKVVYDELSK
ncbi:retrovirus-related pol polyprotein from transposon TNT 1-94, partial [Tanacetum coccineum]